MNVKMKSTHRTLILGVLLLSSLVPFAAAAESVSGRYKNDADITHLFLWSDDLSDMTIANADLSDKKLSGWTIENLSKSLVLVHGPEVKKSTGKFAIDFNVSVAPFRYTFAEVLYNAIGNIVSLQAAGSVTYDGKKFLKPVDGLLSAQQAFDVRTYFSPAAAVVPVPNSVILMMSALGFMGIVKRKTAHT
jgi:hypothetical protein